VNAKCAEEAEFVRHVSAKVISSPEGPKQILMYQLFLNS